MCRHKRSTVTPKPPRCPAPPSKEKGGMQHCPMRDGLCMMDCAWYMAGAGCAMTVLAGQAARQGNELYAIAEILQGGHVDTTDEGGGAREQ